MALPTYEELTGAKDETPSYEELTGGTPDAALPSYEQLTAPKRTAPELAADPDFNAAQYLVENPDDHESAIEAAWLQYQQPYTVGGAVRGTGKFLKGVGSSIAEGIPSLARGVARGASNAAYRATHDDDEAKRRGLENAAGVSLGMTGAVKMAMSGGDKLHRVWQALPYTDNRTREDVAQHVRTQAAALHEMENARRGILPTAESEGGGSAMERALYSGVKSAGPDTFKDDADRAEFAKHVEDISEVADPTNIPIVGAALAPPKFIAKAAGATMKGVGRAGEAVAGATERGVKNLAKARIARRAAPLAVAADIVSTGGAGTLGGAAAGASTWLGSKIAKGGFRMVREAGDEMLGGFAARGQSIYRIATKEAMKGAAGAIGGAVPMMAGAETAEEAGGMVGPAFAIGATVGLTKGALASRGIHASAHYGAMVKSGERDTTFSTAQEARVDGEMMRQLPKPVRDIVNYYRGLTNGGMTPEGKPIKVRAVDSTQFAAEAGQAARGLFYSPDGTLLVTVGDIADGKFKPRNGQHIAETFAHEGKHALDAMLEAAQPEVHRDLFKKIREQFTVNDPGGAMDGAATPEFMDWIQGQMQLHLDSLIEKGASKEEIDAALGGKDMKYWLNEASADIGQSLMTGSGLGEFMLPKSLTGKVWDGLKGWAHEKGIPLPTADTRTGALNSPTAQGIVRKIRQQLYAQGAEARARLEARDATAAKGQNVRQRIDELRPTAERPITPTTPLVEREETLKAKREMEALQKDIGQQAPPTPFQTAPAPPAAPSVPNVPASAKVAAPQIAAKQIIPTIRELFGGTAADAQIAIDAVHAESPTPLTTPDDILNAVIARANRMKRPAHPASQPIAPASPNVIPPKQEQVQQPPSQQPRENAVPERAPETATPAAGEETPVKVPGVEPAPATTIIADHPTVEVPLGEITLSTDVPNFKEDADPRTGVVRGQELQGRYSRLGSAPIVLWRRTNGDLEVITGRHRLDLARRSGEKSIPAQIVDEAKGFTREKALIFDAEANIKDGQGTIKDYAHYFRNAQIDESLAKARGLLSRAKGRDGFDVGRNAGDDLYSIFAAGKLHPNEQTNEQLAVAIAQAAPGNAALQQIGIKAALEGKSPQFIADLIKAVRAATGGRADTLDLFGNDDAAMNQMAEQAARAGEIQRQIRDDMTNIRDRRRAPEIASRLGVDPNDPESVKAAIAELKAELARWENWPLHPDLVAKTRGEEIPEPQPESSQPPVSEVPKNAPPERRRNISLGAHGQRVVEFETMDDVNAFTYTSDMKKLMDARGQLTDQQRKDLATNAKQKLANLVKSTGLTEQELRNKLGDYSKAVIDQARGVEEDGKFTAQSFAEFIKPKEANAPPSEPAPEPKTDEPVPPRTIATVERDVPPDAPPKPAEISQGEIRDIAALSRQQVEDDLSQNYAIKPEGMSLATREGKAWKAQQGGKKPVSKKEADAMRNRAVIDSVAREHAARTPANYQGIKLRVDAFGEERITGTIQEGRPFDDFLLNESGATDSDKAAIREASKMHGKVISLKYAHARGTPDEVNYAATRKAAQKKSPAKGRIERGEAQVETKVIVPEAFQFNPVSKSITLLGAQPEKLLNNFEFAAEAAQVAGEKVPYRDIHDPHYVADLRGLGANNAAGYTWDGRPIQPLPDLPNLTPKPTGEGAPYKGFIGADGKPDLARFEFLNLTLGDESARAGARGGTPQQGAKQTLAVMNRGEGAPVSASGEVNTLRERINEKLGPQELVDENGQLTGKTASWSKVFMENPLSENLLVSNIVEVHPSVERGASPLHEHGYRGDLDRFFAKGAPSRIGAAARFMPEESSPRTPQERAQERQRDRAYLAAVKAGDEKEMQRHVDEAAKAAGYRMETWRGEQSGDEHKDFSGRREPAIFTSQNKSFAKEYTNGRGEPRRFYVKADKVLDLANPGLDEYRWMGEWGKEYEDDGGWRDPQSGEETSASDVIAGGGLFDYEGNWSSRRWKDLQRVAKAQGYDVLIAPDKGGGTSDESVSTIILNDGHIKLSDPITRDDSGRVIPLSERFNPASNDIRFMPESDAKDIVPAIRIGGKVLRGKPSESHQDILNRYLAAHPGDAAALTDFDTKTNPNFFLRGDEEISRGELKANYGVSDSQGLARLQKYDPNADKSPVIESDDSPWIQRWEQLYQKDRDGKLADAEEIESDQLHQRIIREFGSLDAFDKARIAEGKGGRDEAFREKTRGSRFMPEGEATPQQRAKDRIRLRELSAPGRTLTVPEQAERDRLERSAGQKFMDFAEPVKDEDVNATLRVQEKARQRMELRRRREARLVGGDVETQKDLLGPATDKSGNLTLFMPEIGMKEDARAQMPWLDAQMKARGFSGVGDTSAKAHAAKVKLAAQWRQYHRRDEAGNYLQNTSAEAINRALYGARKSDEKQGNGGGLAGEENALGDALAFVQGNARGRLPSSLKGSKGEGLAREHVEREKLEKRDQGQADALAKWAKSKGMLLDSLQEGVSATDKISGREHNAYPTNDGRWIKVSRGFGITPQVGPNGEIELTPGNASTYLQRIADQNALTGDDIRVHGVIQRGDTVCAVTSQPDVSGGDLTEDFILDSMKKSGFEHIGGSNFYRAKDNTAVFDFHWENGAVVDGMALPYDVIVIHPDATLKRAIARSIAELESDKGKGDPAADFARQNQSERTNRVKSAAQERISKRRVSAATP